MSDVVFTRVDARLVHGQVATRWTKVTQAKKIVVVDNKTASDDFLKELLLLAAPTGVEIIIHNERSAVAAWKKDEFGSGPIILLFKEIEAAKRVYENGVQYESLDIGQVPKTPDRRQASNTVHLSDNELDALVSLQSKGVEVYFQPTPEEKATPLSKVVQRMRS